MPGRVRSCAGGCPRFRCVPSSDTLDRTRHLVPAPVSFWPRQPRASPVMHAGAMQRPHGRHQGPCRPPGLLALGPIWIGCRLHAIGKHGHPSNSRRPELPGLAVSPGPALTLPPGIWPLPGRRSSQRSLARDLPYQRPTELRNARRWTCSQKAQAKPAAKDKITELSSSCRCTHRCSCLCSGSPIPTLCLPSLLCVPLLVAR